MGFPPSSAVIFWEETKALPEAKSPVHFSITWRDNQRGNDGSRRWFFVQTQRSLLDVTLQLIYSILQFEQSPNSPN